ncbi:alcohol dehydrogenase-like 7 [Cajanus cajan]|uniref:alcohol dehydrogenase-like 7 n=1 Tax=Cajanus cajan TaxID=3821 RepID=UPI00098D9F2F|nr:alcohol dehydrogenase-like 7 [Cajanus cajan]
MVLAFIGVDSASLGGLDSIGGLEENCGKKFGVTDFVNAGECGNKPIIIEKTGTGADYCFECVGMASLILEAYASCRMGWGKTIVLGVDRPGAKINLNSHDVLHDGKSLMGSLFGGLKPKSHVPILLKRYVDKEL